MEKNPLVTTGNESAITHRVKAVVALGLVSLGFAGHSLAEANDGGGTPEQHTPRSRQLKIPELRLFDIGAADYNNDGYLDVFTANHSYPSALLENSGTGTFTNVTNSAGYGQDLAFENFEKVDRQPLLEKPGAYVYMSRENKKSKKSPLNIEAVGQSVSGSITLDPEHEIYYANAENGTASVESHDGVGTISFDLEAGGRLETRTTLQVPSKIKIDGDTPTFVGPDEIPAPDNSFNVVLPDHHADVFVDLNNDGRDDLLRVVGGLGGGIQMPAFRGKIPDITRQYTDNGYENIQLGLQKDNCRGRQAAAVDANADGLTDLWQSCEGDGSFIQYKHPDGSYSREVIPDDGESYRWLQSGPSSLPKLLALGKNASLWLRGESGWEKTSSSRLIGGAGQTTLGDYNHDGNPDIFVSNSKGNTLVTVQGQDISSSNPSRIGLPNKSSAAAWVDVDNNGTLDLDSLPLGLYKSSPNGTYHPTGIFQEKTKYGHMTWADFDNDGFREPIIGKSPREFSMYGKALFFGTDILNQKQKSDWLEVDSPSGWLTSRMTMKVPGEPVQIAWVGQSETSRFSQGHNRVYFALPNHSKAATVSLTSPAGQKYKVTSPANRVIRIP